MAGARQEPPVSSHKDQGANLAATAAADPALLPVQTQAFACSVLCFFSFLVMKDLSDTLNVDEHGSQYQAAAGHCIQMKHTHMKLQLVVLAHVPSSKQDGDWYIYMELKINLYIVFKFLAVLSTVFNCRQTGAVLPKGK